MSRPKYAYSITPDNRLIIRDINSKKALSPRGKFTITKDNQLLYWLNEPYGWRKAHNLARKISFKGNWRLNKNYDLELSLEKSRNQPQADTFVISGNIIHADSGSLTFEVKTYDEDGLLHIQILKLNVTWLADSGNRLSFIVKKYSPDIIVLDGEWQVNQQQQITYRYEKTNLKTKSKISNTVIFQGFWQINSANKLTYILQGGSGSKFDFRAQVETPNVYPQAGLIKYRLGVGARGQRQVKEKEVYLYGVWKFSRRMGLDFQIDYGRGNITGIEFNAEADFSKNNKVVFGIKNKAGEPLGFSLIFSHNFLRANHAEAFLRLRALRKEAGVDIGVRIPF